MDDVDVLAPEKLLSVFVAGDAESSVNALSCDRSGHATATSSAPSYISKRPREPACGVPVTQPEDRHSPFMHS